jgi:cytidylate kinase
MLPADDAVVLETDGMSPEQVIDRLVALLEARRRMTGRTAGQS